MCPQRGDKVIILLNLIVLIILLNIDAQEVIE